MSQFEYHDAFEHGKPDLPGIRQDVIPFLTGYVAGLLFGETIEHEDREDAMPLECGFHWEDFTQESQALIIKDCVSFYVANREDIEVYGEKEAGADFYFTRQGHGVGFWEEDYGTPEICERLDGAAEAEGPCYLSVTEDGMNLEYR